MTGSFFDYTFAAWVSPSDYESIAGIVNCPEHMAFAVPGDCWEIEDGALVYRFGRVASLLHYPETDERSGDYIQFDKSDGIYVVDNVCRIESYKDEERELVRVLVMFYDPVELMDGGE